MIGGAPAELRGVRRIGRQREQSECAAQRFAVRREQGDARFDERRDPLANLERREFLGGPARFHRHIDIGEPRVDHVARAARKGEARDVGVDADARGGIGERGVTEPVERRRGGNQRRERGANFVEGRVGGQDRGHERQIGRAARFGNRAGTTMSTRTFFAVI